MKIENKQLNQFTWSGIISFLALFTISLIFFLSFPIITTSTAQCGQSNVEPASQPKPEVEISTDGTMKINGEPFFPFGFYHVSWGSTIKQRGKHLQEIADAGFNVVHASLKQEESLDSYGKFLDRADKLGVKVITEFGLEPTINPLVAVNRFKNKPAVLGWNIADDAGVPAFNPIKPRQVLSLHCQVKEVDPDRITYISGSLYKLLNFANFADAIGFQAYPVGGKHAHRIGLAHELIAHMVSSVPQNRMVIANSQAFRKYEANAPIPTSQQLRNMTYQALVAGAKGIIYYTYYDAGKWYLAEHPSLWQGVQSLVPEIEQISPMLLTGKRQKVRTRNKNVLSSIWTKKDRSLAIVINTSADRPQKVSLTLAANNIQTDFPSDSDNFKLENGKLSGMLPPLEVLVYRFKTAPE